MIFSNVCTAFWESVNVLRFANDPWNENFGSINFHEIKKKSYVHEKEHAENDINDAEMM